VREHLPWDRGGPTHLHILHLHSGVCESRRRVGFRVDGRGEGVGGVTVVEIEKMVVVEPEECRR
jgi:hypothetical protein